MRGALPLEDDVEHGMQPRRAGQRGAQLALADRERLAVDLP